MKKQKNLQDTEFLSKYARTKVELEKSADTKIDIVLGADSSDGQHRDRIRAARRRAGK